ncbi:hypothetical protein [Sphingomonas soli]|uniref:hypothetical protein n=1 Tax=Sphingomonas soli TaxID=266127 RepID=UPI000829D1F9|nr:hypothetical protein [Sphingomonas soli]
MPLAALSMKLHLSSISEGLTFTVTGVENTKTSSISSSHSAPNRYEAAMKRQGWYDIDPAHSRTIAKISHHSTNTFSTDEIINTFVRFRIHGHADGRDVDKSGYFQLTSTEWGRLERPDFAALLVQIEGSDAYVIHRKTPSFVEPDPFYVAVEVQDGKIAVAVSTEDELSTTVLSHVIGGILEIHKKAITWVVGAL